MDYDIDNKFITILNNNNIFLKHYFLSYVCHNLFKEENTYKQSKLGCKIFTLFIDNGIDLNITKSADEWNWFMCTSIIRFFVYYCCNKLYKITKDECNLLKLLLFKSSRKSKQGILEICIYYKKPGLVKKLLKESVEPSWNDIISCITLKGNINLFSYIHFDTESNIYKDKNINILEFLEYINGIISRTTCLKQIITYLIVNNRSIWHSLYQKYKYPLLILYNYFCKNLRTYSRRLECISPYNLKCLNILKRITFRKLIMIDTYIHSLVKKQHTIIYNNVLIPSSIIKYVVFNFIIKPNNIKLKNIKFKTYYIDF